MKDNKLIAEFMGLPKERVGLKQEVIYGLNQDDWYTSDNLNYHLSWDWLMPVIQKVNEVSGYNDYNTDRLHIQRVLDDCISENAVGIDEVHKAVVEFIKKYNRDE